MSDSGEGARTEISESVPLTDGIYESERGLSRYPAVQLGSPSNVVIGGRTRKTHVTPRRVIIMVRLVERDFGHLNC